MFAQDTTNALKNWIPARLISGQDEMLCRWLYTGNLRFCDPFFDKTLHRYKTLPENSTGYKSVSQASVLYDSNISVNSIPPTAFIFHVSRCGSTLISQALGLSKQHISLSEVPFLDEILRLPYKKTFTPNTETGAMLAGAVKFYGAQKTPEEQHLFIKTDSWHLLFYKQYRALYPDTPFIIIYREPSAVLESNARHKGMQGTFGIIEPEVFDFKNTSIDTLIHPDRYMIEVLKKFYSAIIDNAATDNKLLLLNYDEGLNVMLHKIIQFTAIAPSAADLSAMEARGTFHAKEPAKKFTEENTNASHYHNEDLKRLYTEIEGMRVSATR